MQRSIRRWKILLSVGTHNVNCIISPESLKAQFLQEVFICFQICFFFLMSSVWSLHLLAYYFSPARNFQTLETAETPDIFKAIIWSFIWNIIYLNCGERYEDIIYHRSYAHNLSRCEIKAWKKFRSERDSNPWPLQSSTNWAIKPSGCFNFSYIYDSFIAFHANSY